MLEIETPHGPARVELEPAATPRAALVLGHGAGGGIHAPDLVAVAEVARAAGLSLALVEQPYRVAGRRSPPPARNLDAAWMAVIERLRSDELEDLPLICGGRSSGARVACRCAAESDAIAILCLAFPLEPPTRKPTAVKKTRQPELDAVSVPMLIVQGERDQFGMPKPAAKREVSVVPGNHSLKSDLPAVAAAVSGWLPRVLD